jgi:hypothetical protein
MAKLRVGIPLLTVILALLACAPATPERFLDQACGEKQCKTTGSARETSGLTSDSIGFELGPGPGSVTIAVDVPAGTFPGRFELLVRGSGSLVVTVAPAGCTDCGSHSIELHDDWRWEVAKEGVTGQSFSVTVETLDDTTQAKLLDLRVW